MMKSFTVSMINQDGILDLGVESIPDPRDRDRFEDDFFASLFFKLVPREVKSFVDALDSTHLVFTVITLEAWSSYTPEYCSY